MIGVKKIAHATYEMPDVDKQVEYYTEIMGLTVTGKEKDAVFLASTVDHHSVVLRKGGDKARCVRLGFQIAPDDDLDAFETPGAGPRHQDRAQEGSGAVDLGCGDVRRSERHGHGGVQARRVRRPALSRPRASCRTSSATSRSS